MAVAKDTSGTKPGHPVSRALVFEHRGCTTGRRIRQQQFGVGRGLALGKDLGGQAGTGRDPWVQAGVRMTGQQPGCAGIVKVMTVELLHRTGPNPPEIHGPAAVRAALLPYATPETLALYDREVDEATVASAGLDSVAPLLQVLAHWWETAELAAHGPGPGHRHAGGRERTIAAWEAAHPGQNLFPNAA